MRLGSALGPCSGRDLRDLMIGHCRQPVEEILKVGIGIDLETAAVADEGVEHRGAISGLGIPYEQPVLLSDRAGPDRVLAVDVVDLHAAILQEQQQTLPLAQSV